MSITNTFIEHAADILGDTKTGLTGSQIAEYMSSYAYDLYSKQAIHERYK